MNWLLNVGDTDILRSAVTSAEVFQYRARRAPRILVGGAGLVVLLLVLLVLLVVGPAQVGLPVGREGLAVALAFAAIMSAFYFGWMFFQFMPGRNDRVVLGLRRWVRQEIDPLEERMARLSDEELRAQTAEFRARLAGGASADEIRAEAYACVREASRRARAHRQFECQLIGGKIIEDCNVAEMRTGEGKTIVCYMANYLKALQGLQVHMVTVNDYLVKRDAEFARPIFELLGVSVGYITSEMETHGPGVEVRRAAYNCDITYGTNSEFGFDYLRDNMKMSARDQVQGKQDFVVVDEVDSILIDEARTPLIISGPTHDDVSVYQVADGVARKLIARQKSATEQTALRLPEIEAHPTPYQKQDPKFWDGLKKFKTDPLWLDSNEAEAIGHLQFYVVEADRKSAHMTEHGAKFAQQELGLGTFYDSKNMNWPHYLDNALKAHLVYQRDKEYVIQDGTIVIVDEFTGRLMQGRQWSDGLHQAVEAKEGVRIKQETQTLATITLQNLFKMYKSLAGMTGTAMTESDEFMKIYRLEVLAVPTNKPVRRVDYNDKIYKTEVNKFDAIVEEIQSCCRDGFPSDPWSRQDMLKFARQTLQEAERHGLADAEVPAQLAAIDQALRAFQDGKGDPEALAAGYRALMGPHIGGRPILVGTASVEKSEKLSKLLTTRYGIDHEVLNAKNHAREAEIVTKAGQQHEQIRAGKKTICGNVTIATNMAGRGTDIRLGPGVAEIGGLHVVGTERHESRRIDNQLRGRCGRQGDSGSSRFFLSLGDDLLRLFMGEWVLRMLNLLGFEEGMAIEDKRLTRGIERAQKKVEERNFGIRKNLLEYDEVMDYQRKTFYTMRQQVVEGKELSQLIWGMIDQSVQDAVERFFDPAFPALCASEWLAQQLGVQVDTHRLDTRDGESLLESAREQAGNEVRGNIERTFGEYIDPDIEPAEWDVRGLAGWVEQYGLTLTQNEIRHSEPSELLERIIEAAARKIESADLSPLVQFVDPQYGRTRLCRWAREKFDVDVPVEDLRTLPRDETIELFSQKMRAAYRKREIEYPISAAIDFAVGRSGANLNEAYGRLAHWCNRKYGFDWTYEHFAGKDPQQIFQELRTVNEDYLANGKLDREIDQALLAHQGPALVDWAKQRFGWVVNEPALREANGQQRELLRQFGYEMLRYELTQIEALVLLNVFDAAWKDHMYTMDLLRSGIGLRGYGERDPKIEYKKEGTRMFNEMMVNIRERVTDLIFKVHVTTVAGDGPAAAAPAGGATPYGRMAAGKADATGAGFATPATADQRAAMARQGEGAAQPQTIRREAPRVGRNDPCPCGSGKKFKQCHGKGQ